MVCWWKRRRIEEKKLSLVFRTICKNRSVVINFDCFRLFQFAARKYKWWSVFPRKGFVEPRWSVDEGWWLGDSLSPIETQHQTPARHRYRWNTNTDLHFKKHEQIKETQISNDQTTSEGFVRVVRWPIRASSLTNPSVRADRWDPVLNWHQSDTGQIPSERFVRLLTDRSEGKRETWNSVECSRLKKVFIPILISAEESDRRLEIVRSVKTVGDVAIFHSPRLCAGSDPVWESEFTRLR